MRPSPALIAETLLSAIVLLGFGALPFVAFSFVVKP